MGYETRLRVRWLTAAGLGLRMGLPLEVWKDRLTLDAEIVDIEYQHAREVFILTVRSLFPVPAGEYDYLPPVAYRQAS